MPAMERDKQNKTHKHHISHVQPSLVVRPSPSFAWW